MDLVRSRSGGGDSGINLGRRVFREGQGSTNFYFRVGVGNTRNGVGIMISSLTKENVEKVNRVSNRITKIKLVVKEEVVNIVEEWSFVLISMSMPSKSFIGPRELLCCQDDEQVDMRRILYKEARRTTKKIVEEAKSKAYEAMYNHLGTKKGQNGIYRLAKTSDIPQEWRLSMVVPIYKNKGDAQDCSNYRDLEKAYDSVPREAKKRSCSSAQGGGFSGIGIEKEREAKEDLV
ncbi:hypothetical protein AgCh_001045 [Apium graveolens]